MSEQKPVIISTESLNIFLTEETFKQALKAEREKAYKHCIQIIESNGNKYDEAYVSSCVDQINDALLSTDESKENEK